MKKKYIAGVVLTGLISFSILPTTILSMESKETVKIENTAPEVAQVVEVVPETPEITETKIPLGEFTVTAYCPCEKCCGAWADGIVYTGGYATENQTIAVDPDVIPLGSVVEFNGNRYIAEDIGGAIKNNKIDLFMLDHQDALNWGVQKHEVYLIEEA